MTQDSSDKLTHAPLQRGKACNICRRRKIKCDGQRPKCGPCTRSPKSEECVYVESGRARTQVLEATIARLEARVRELESENRIGALPLVVPSEEPHPPHPISIRLDSSDSSLASSPLMLQNELLDSSDSANSPSVSGSVGRPQEEPPMSIIKQLLETFLPHASEFGFFLDPARFFDDAIRPLPIGHHSRPCRALLNAVYLFGSRMSQSTYASYNEETFLNRALEDSATNLLSDHPHKILHGIQAHVLLVLYFYSTARVLEGRTHSYAAISLVMGLGLHKIRSVRGARGVPSGAAVMALPPAMNSTEEGERILAFWTVYGLHNCWSVALGYSMTLPADFPAPQIDTPWPVDVNQYEQIPAELHGDSTVQKFLSNSVENSFGEFSTLAMFCKASVLWETAARYAVLYETTMPLEDAKSFVESLTPLIQCIEQFIAALPNITQMEMTLPDAIRPIFVTHTLAHTASIKLYGIFAKSDARSRGKCLTSALAVAGLIKGVDIQNFQYINPIIGTLWMTTCEYLICEITQSIIWERDTTPRAKLDEMAAAIECCFGAMALFSFDCPLIENQLKTIQQKYSAISG